MRFQERISPRPCLASLSGGGGLFTTLALDARIEVIG